MRSKNLLFYVFLVGGFLALILYVIHEGKLHLEPQVDIHRPFEKANHWLLFKETLFDNITHPLAILLLQIVTILVVARLFSWLFSKVGQPSVIGEIVAGIVLGPSLVGYYFPGFTAFLFPEHSLENLHFLSQIGLILFMFVVGMELDLSVLKKQAHEAVVISHASIIFPFALGLGLAYFIYLPHAPKGVPFISFGLFLGISMSITAFPVLARIVQERGIHKTRVGAIVITCAAADDVTAWSLLAVVIAIVKAGSLLSALPTIIMAVGYVFVLLKVIRPFLKRVGDLHASPEILSKDVVAMFFLVLLISSYTTEIVGIHALFGAFMAGVVMPDNTKFKRIFIEKVEDVALVLLLPLFFVYTGLRTQLGLLNDPEMWQLGLAVVAVAITGKFVGSAVAARYTGRNWHDSLTIGALMNTRGLVELVALNIGYDLGVLTPEIFTVLVLMALITTFMTAPSLHFIEKLFAPKKVSSQQEVGDHRKYSILLSFGNPEMGKTLLDLAHALTAKQALNTTISALHLSPIGMFNKYKVEKYERESFEPVLKKAQLLGRKVKTLFKVSENIGNDIVEMANNGGYDLLLMGIGQSIYEGSALGNLISYSGSLLQPDRLYNKIIGREKLFAGNLFPPITLQVLEKTRKPVGILINNELQEPQNLLLPLFSPQDAFLIEYAKKIITNFGAQVMVVDAVKEGGMDPVLKERIRSIENIAPDYIALTSRTIFGEPASDAFDLMMVSLTGWTMMVKNDDPWVGLGYSVLVVSHPVDFN